MLSTCEWLFQHPGFQNWYNDEVSNEHSNLFWIKGKPDCGKSTLMKAALERARRRECKNRARRAVVTYFFNARALSALEKSAPSLYRTIVHHLLSSGDLLRPLFMERFALKNPGLSGENWTVEGLQRFLFDSVECDEPFDLCLFIDALDEAQYEDDVRDMISFLIQLADRASSMNGCCHSKMCLSSRYLFRGRPTLIFLQPVSFQCQTPLLFVTSASPSPILPLFLHHSSFIVYMNFVRNLERSAKCSLSNFNLGNTFSPGLSPSAAKPERLFADRSFLDACDRGFFLYTRSKMSLRSLPSKAGKFSS